LIFIGNIKKPSYALQKKKSFRNVGIRSGSPSTEALSVILIFIETLKSPLTLFKKRKASEGVGGAGEYCTLYVLNNLNRC